MSVDPPQPPAEDLDWSRVLAWLPRFSAPEFRAGEWAGGEEREPGVFTMPFVAYSEEVREFIGHLNHLQVVSPFDWGTWGQDRGKELGEDPQRLAEASLEECRMLLTAHVRADRFSEGHLLQAFESGYIVAILERVSALVDAS